MGPAPREKGGPMANEFQRLCLGNRGIPVIGRMSPSQHALKDATGMGFSAIGPLGGLVIDPGQDDHSSVLVEAEEQPVLLEKLGASPVPVLWAER